MTHIFLLLFLSLSWLLPHQSLHLFWPVQSWPYQEHASIPESNNQGILTTINVDHGDDQKNKIHTNETSVLKGIASNFWSEDVKFCFTLSNRFGKEEKYIHIHWIICTVNKQNSVFIYSNNNFQGSVKWIMLNYSKISAVV